jgi:Asp-tRNA(Asn)/Glu-tRNA(Gln) amidotransferase A subunit family amidase
MTELADLTALEARRRLERGEVAAVEVTRACLDRIAERDGAIGAWVHLDPDLAMAQAKAADRHRQSGRPLGALHGVPVGVKDIIDTTDFPTENGTIIDAGRRPQKDATVVTRLRAAGAVILGKTVTTECAYMAPSATRNPHQLEHTPGGSSAGSAAAVAASMVPLAIGTQTAGSVTRPASYCGVIGFKPSFGLIARSGILQHSPFLDTVGVFARSVEDSALLADALAGYDPGDAHSTLSPSPLILETARTPPPVTPLLAFVANSATQALEPDCEQGFAELVETLGKCCDTLELPAVFAEAGAAQRRLALAGMARGLRRYAERGHEQLAEETRAGLEEGAGIRAQDYLSALDWREVLSAGLDEIFTRYDALITPAVAGEAPKGLDSTGSPAFCVLWTLTGLPTITLPLLEGSSGMPIGVQLVGRRGNDGRLLRTACWLVKMLQETS